MTRKIGVGAPSRQYLRTEGIDNLAHMGMVMDGLASFHARWWGTKKRGRSSRVSPLKWAIHPLQTFTWRRCGLAPRMLACTRGSQWHSSA